MGVLDRSRVIDVAADHDVFVLPTKHEGVPVALIEGMSVGLVPVASDLRSGVREVVEPGVSGFTPAQGDIAGFAGAIATLSRDRSKLESMSHAARARVEQAFDVRFRVRGWQDLFARHHEFRRPRRHRPQHLYGSRLDKPWLPNTVVRAIRSFRRSRA
jgi:glycosyltransferase involved in cell wall biosynthesis